jgi:hypothetical protein
MRFCVLGGSSPIWDWLLGVSEYLLSQFAMDYWLVVWKL